MEVLCELREILLESIHGVSEDGLHLVDTIRTALSGDESETCLEQRMAELEASILRLCADDAIHTPVDQTNMSEGSIELF